MKYFPFLAIFISSVACHAQLITFQKTYGPGTAFSAQPTADGGYMLMGMGWDTTGGSPFLLKTNGTGDTLWTKFYDLNYIMPWIPTVENTADGGYMLTGITWNTPSNHDLLLLKTNSIGDVEWAKSYGGSKNEEGYSAQQTSDGGYIVCGATESFGAGQTDLYLVRTNSSGDTLWTKAYGSTRNDEARSVRQTADGGFIISGRYNNSKGIYLIKTNTAGDTLWTKTFGGLIAQEGWCVEQNPDGSYMILGYADNLNPNLSDFYLMKNNSDGSIQWAKTYGNLGDDYPYSVRATADGGYILVGQMDFHMRDILLIKTDAKGDTLWTNSFGSPLQDYAFTAFPTPDGGYVIAGQMQESALFKTDSLGRSCNNANPGIHVDSIPLSITSNTTHVSTGKATISNLTVPIKRGRQPFTYCQFIGIPEIENSEIRIDVFPDPFSSATTATLPDNIRLSPKTELLVYNVLGNKIKKQTITSHSIAITRDGLPSGMYFFKIVQDQNLLASGKFIIQ